MSLLGTEPQIFHFLSGKFKIVPKKKILIFLSICPYICVFVSGFSGPEQLK